jgi:ribosomal protein L30/L7E
MIHEVVVAVEPAADGSIAVVSDTVAFVVVDALAV